MNSCGSPDVRYVPVDGVMISKLSVLNKLETSPVPAYQVPAAVAQYAELPDPLVVYPLLLFAAGSNKPQIAKLIFAPGLSIEWGYAAGTTSRMARQLLACQTSSRTVIPHLPTAKSF
jgi:hypothetical protein